MRNIKVIRFICLAVLVFSTFSCSKDELVEDLCIDEVAAAAYNIETDELNRQDWENEVDGRFTYLAPVCGCNGKSYFNDHLAKLEGVVSWTRGECK